MTYRNKTLVQKAKETLPYQTIAVDYLNPTFSNHRRVITSEHRVENHTTYFYRRSAS